MAWLLFEFQPSTLFALKSSYATSTVASSLMVPTPYVIKMAFLNAAFRSGKDETFCRELVERLARVRVRIKPASESIITQTIQKVRVPKEEKGKREPVAESKATDKLTEYQSTVAYREVVWLKDSWVWAFDVGDDATLANDLRKLAPCVNYVGKRGSFVQLINASEQDGELGPGFTVPLEESGTPPIEVCCHVAPLDDFGSEMTFDAANSYNQESKVRLNKHRRIIPTLVPSRVTNSGYGFRRYSR